MSKNFLLYAKYYDLLYKEKNYIGECKYITKLIKDFAPGSTNILELGSGTGNHGLLLKSAGYSVFGVELSREMALVAKSKGFECDICDIVKYRTSKKYDVIISLFHVVSYLTANEDLISVFNNMNSVLNDNGIFLFDVWYTPAVYEQKPEVRIKKIQNEELEITRISKPEIDYNKHIVNVKFTVFVKDKLNEEYTELNEIHPMRHFSYNEISLLSDLTGFELVHSEEFFTGNVASNNTWGVCFVLKKISKGSESK
jgi:SAM-dependent methyltransferase